MHKFFILCLFMCYFISYDVFFSRELNKGKGRKEFYLYGPGKHRKMTGASYKKGSIPKEVSVILPT